jgi:hypothetical protein
MYNNRESIQPSPAYFKLITIIHVALLAGQVLFGVVSYSITNSKGLDLNPGDDVFFYIAPLLIIGGMLVGTFLFKQQVAKLADKELLPVKLAAYQTALIIRFALSEGPSMFGIVVYMLTGNLFYLILTAVNVLYFIWIKPTKAKAKEDLNLTYEEEIAIEG